jgi:hypothetical protein
LFFTGFSSAVLVGQPTTNSATREAWVRTRRGN